MREREGVRDGRIEMEGVRSGREGAREGEKGAEGKMEDSIKKLKVGRIKQ